MARRRRTRDQDHDDLPYVVIERRGSGAGPFIVGALLGAGIALLFAPRSGREVREGITTGVRRLKETAEDTVRNVQESVNTAIGGVREQVVGRIDAARGAFDAGREAARESRADMERRIREARAGFDAGVQAARKPSRPTAASMDEEEDEDIIL